MTTLDRSEDHSILPWNAASLAALGTTEADFYLRIRPVFDAE